MKDAGVSNYLQRRKLHAGADCGSISCQAEKLPERKDAQLENPLLPTLTGS